MAGASAHAAEHHIPWVMLFSTKGGPDHSSLVSDGRFHG
jgi:hypothetical protein